MEISNVDLRKKAQGFVQAIEKMTPKERDGRPTVTYGEDYNTLISMVHQANPGLQRLLPPTVKIINAQNGQKWCAQPYHEILTFCAEIVNLLS